MEKFIISCSIDKTIKIWELKSGKNIASIEGHTDQIWGLTITPDGKKIISADENIKIWELKSGKNIATLENNDEEIYGLSVTPNGKQLISGSADGTIKIWDLTKILPLLPEEGMYDHVRYTNAKIALLGESGVGKTGLALRLAKNEWYPTESTHGMNIWPIELPNNTDEDMDREVWLWDFAGQPDYRLIHQLYMEQISLAMIVIDPQKENPLEPLVHWENALVKAASVNTRKILVAGRCDRGGISLSKAKLEDYCSTQQYIAFYATEAKTGSGCEVLKNAISESIPWNDLSWTTTTLVFKKLKDAIIQLKKKAHVLMPFDSLKQQLQLGLTGTKIDTAEILAVLGLLEGQGIIKILTFGDLILLQPEQINHYASAIIKVVRDNTEEIGHISKKDVLEANIEFGDLERLEPSNEASILRFIVQTFIERNICLQEETNAGTQLVFPSYFKVERPELVEAPNVFVTYSFEGVYDEIYSTLIVRLIHTNDFEKDIFWKNAADFSTHTKKKAGSTDDQKRKTCGIKDLF